MDNLTKKMLKIVFWSHFFNGHKTRNLFVKMQIEKYSNISFICADFCIFFTENSTC